MSLSRFLQNLVIGAALAAAVTGEALAQAGFSTNGGEYSVTGPLRGDQTFPRAGLSSLGGYVVWHDSAADGRNPGIAAVAVNSSLVKTSALFQVNQRQSAILGEPSVALLKDGGAVFVWQAGNLSIQRVFARFLSSSNTWVGGDVLVSAYTNNFQRHPSVAVLANGNVIVVWGSLNQRSANSYQDVYGQILSPSGQKIGAEFPINQYLAFHQRSAVVCALADGGFVVAWISEQQRNAVPTSSDADQEFFPSVRPSVDVYARKFDQVGAPLGSEFLVNSTLNPCADPSVAAAADGEYVVVWAEKDNQTRNNGWEIQSRVCRGAATAGSIVRVNTYVQGDQFAPQAELLGANYLVSWTSMGQDGSWEGVYARFLQKDGSLAGEELLVNSTRLSRQIQPAVATDGSARFLVTWSGFSSIQRGFDLFGQQYALAGFVPLTPVVAKYAAPTNSASGGNGGTGADPGSNGDSSSNPDLQLTTPPFVELTATTTASNSFAIIKGNYNGLFYQDDQALDPARCGALNVNVLTGGSYSGRLVYGARAFSFSGKFSAQNGWSTNTLRLSTTASLTLRLQLDAAQGYQLGGTVTDKQGLWTAQVHADRLTWDRLKHPATLNGKPVTYTAVLSPGTNQAVGYGYGTVRLDPSGIVSWSGTLADGTKVSQSTTLSREGYWPLYSALSGTSGVLLGWMHHAGEATSDLNGTAIWIKGPLATAKYYPEGLSCSLTVQGSTYVAPAVGATVMGLQQGRLLFSGGQLDSFSGSFTLDSRNRVVNSGENKLNLSFAASGLFTGNTRIPISGKTLSFQGVLFQRGTNGAGMFLGTRQSGRVELTSGL